MTPREVKQLVTLVRTHHHASIDRVEGFRLLLELRRLASVSMNGRRDRSMQATMHDDAVRDLEAPLPRDDSLWDHDPIPCDTSSWTMTGTRRSNPGLSMPSIDEPFVLDEWARYMLYHARPGSPNHFIGLAFNQALQIHYRSVFGFQLSRALSPPSSHGRAHFTRHFAAVAAVPGRYSEYLAEYLHTNPTIPAFINPSTSIVLTRMDLGDRRERDITIDDVFTSLIVNHIPPSWIDHAYTFGLHYINHHYSRGGDIIPYEEIDNERLRWLGVHGVPPALPEWDGWYSPSDEDIGRVQRIMAGEEHDGTYCMDDCSDWLLVGEDPHFDRLFARRQEGDPDVDRGSHSPLPPSPPPLPEDHEMGDNSVMPTRDMDLSPLAAVPSLPTI